MGRRVATRHVIVGLTFACTCVCYIERVGFSIAYTAAADAAGINQSTKGLILSTFFYGYALSQVPGGWAAQRIGGRRVLLFSFIVWSLTTAMVPLDARRVKTLVIARLLVGVAQGFIFPSIHTVLAQWVPPHERSRSVSLTTSGMYFGATAGMLVLPGIVHLRGPRAVFFVEAAMGGIWALVWFLCSTDPPRSDHPKASSAGFGQSTTKGFLPLTGDKEHTNGFLTETMSTQRTQVSIPWKNLLSSFPIWALVLNNFTFDYALYVLMNWLPTYFEMGLHLSLQKMGSSKMLPYLNMFVFSNIGGVIADHLITKRQISVTHTRKWLNTGGFLVAACALVMMPTLRTSWGAVLCSSVCLGSLALGRAVGVSLTGQILESAKAANMDLSNPNSWTQIFYIPAFLCICSAVIFLVFATGERIFD
ncbi:hypothetical protein SUGI_0258830 [Cryptomeria japonica]|nr:hypothetical protein SUGI_0258830 [Cryptomeria japonica]